MSLLQSIERALTGQPTERQAAREKMSEAAKARNQLISKEHEAKKKVKAAEAALTIHRDKERKDALAAAETDLSALSAQLRASVATYEAAEKEYKTLLQSPAPAPAKAAQNNITTRFTPVPVSNETLGALVAIARNREIQILTAEQKDKIENQIMARWDNCYKAVMAHTNQNAKDAWLKHNSALAETIASGKPVTNAEDGWNREDWEEDYRVKMQAAKIAGAKVVEEAIAIAKPCFERFSKFCEDFAIEQEAGEISASENLKIEYKASQIISIIRSAPQAASVKLPTVAMWGTNPKTFIGWLL